VSCRHAQGVLQYFAECIAGCVAACCSVMRYVAVRVNTGPEDEPRHVYA